MAKTLANYDPLVQIPSGMTPAGADFPIVESHDILVGENDKRLDAKLDDIDSAIGNVGQTPIATQLSSKVDTGDIVTSVAATGSTSNNKIPSETAVRAAIEAKTINVDSTVTEGSTNAVSGGAVHTQLATKQDTLTFDTTPTASSNNPVTSGGVKTALDAKQDTLTFDTTPTASSNNPVTSGGVKTALDGKQNVLTYETTPIVGSVNPVTSTGIRNAIDAAAAGNLGEMQAQYDEFVAEAEDVLDRAASLSNGMVACNNIAAETTVGDTRILLYTGTTNANYTNGHWYYNSAPSNAAPSWTDGGAVGSAPTIDNTLTTAGAAADSKSVGDAIENIVTISNTQPGANSGNKVWIKETTNEEVQVPTYAEHIAKANKADIATNNESDNGSGTISASKAYAIGDHFYINNTNTSSENYGVSTLYKATAAIASGSAIVVGTNCEASKVVDELTSLSNDIDTVKADLGDVLNDLSISGSKWHGDLIVSKNAYNKIFENVQLKANTPYRVEFDFPTALSGTSYGAIRKTDGSGNYKAGTLTNKTSCVIEYTPDDDITADISVLIQPNGSYTFDCSWRDTSPTFIEQITTDTTELKSFVSNVQTYEQSGNLFGAKTDALSGRYYYRNNGQLKNGANANYAGFIVPVIPNQNYIFTKSNIVLLDDNKNLVISSGGNYDFAGAQICNSGLATYFAVSYLLTDVPEDGYVMSMGNVIDYGEYGLNVYAKSKKAKLQKPYERFAGMLESGGSFNVSGKSGIRDGYKIVFIGAFEQFNELKIDFVTTSVANYVRITTSQVIVHNIANNTITESHGLTISNDICVLFEMKNGTMYLSVTSLGVTYEYNCVWEWLGSSPSECHVTAIDMSFSQASMVVFYPSDRGIWYFGDSYAAFNTNARVPYYIIKYGFEKDILFNTISGSSSTAAVNTLKYLLKYGIPKYIIFATGMNDGSDADNNTPSSAWLTAVQNFINICQNYNIIPILCTVPTIHTVNNNAKNSWVRTSGYRYIDYADAVGADANGDWYDGMIGIDGIHPSTLGANAQFCQLIADMPEIMK